MEEITLLINVTDLGAQLNAPQTDQAKVRVVLLDVNDNKPSFIDDDQEIADRLRKDSIPENLAPRSLLLTVKAKDIDKNKTEK
uniref:Cadherin domain-containing protein n=1 Tax=Romanomermis culicivorax TaxID=13658 RepID=A0A915HUF6_ROMCU